MRTHDKKLLLGLCTSLGLMLFAGTSFAQEECDPKTDPKCEPPPPPPKVLLCHNIGGPMELGANCDGATGACTFTYMDATSLPNTITVPQNHFLGIFIGAKSERAIAAHLAHGDGFVVATFEPRLHLASTGQIHKGSTVDCLAERAITTQPPEPGN
jgi:hypothetical protein